VVTQAVTFLSYVVLAQLAVPRQFGEYAAGSLVIGVGALVSESGLSAVLVYREERVEEAASTALVAALLGALLMAAAAIGLAPFVGEFFHSSTVGWVTVAMSGYLVVVQLGVVPSALLQRRFSYVRQLTLAPAAALATGAAAITALTAGLGVWAFVIGAYAGALVQTLLSWVFARWRPRLCDVKFSTWRELASYGRHVVASEGFRRVDSEGRNLIVGRVLGTSSLGAYGLAFRVAYQPLALLMNGISYLLFPALARLAKEREQLQTATVKALRFSATITFPLIAVMASLAVPSVTLIFGRHWHPAGIALQWMAAYAIGGITISVASEALKAAGAPKWLPRITVLAAGSTIALTLLLLPLGMAGVGAALSISSTLAGGYALFAVSRALELRLASLVRTLVRPTAAGLVAALASVGMRVALAPAEQPRAAGIALLVGCAATGFVAYVLMLRLLSSSTSTRQLLSNPETAKLARVRPGSAS
jgi:PST family polysaccharide transporter